MFRKYKITYIEIETGRIINLTSAFMNWKELAKTCKDIEKTKFQIITINLEEYENN